ncbi:MAG TPA: n-acetylglutamate synthase [Cytophagales bacterium]|nr:n-acetylglutamate synthase [Cytophagales bacterium]HAA20510.1 n-acetylglutamate synthase [Cytophagales bacterium]HAP59062.1 n-acetylglutamate synthase [Cytophagales bacterium]
MNYNNRIFRAVSNDEHGAVDDSVRFHYRQKGNLLSATYQGGTIREGHLLGTVAEDGSLHFLYHQVHQDGTLHSGECWSKPEELADGRLRMHETWQWTNGQAGKSVLEEVIEESGG